MHSVEETVQITAGAIYSADCMLLSGGIPVCSLAHTLLDDSKTLFSLLGLNGRRRHQAEVAGAVTTICEGLSASEPRVYRKLLLAAHARLCLNYLSAGSDLEVLQRLLSLGWHWSAYTSSRCRSASKH